MDIYLTDLETGARLQFPMLPEKISVSTGAMFQSYNIMAVGEVKIPSGEELTGVSWDGMFPGSVRRGAAYVRAWQPPEEIIRLLEDIRVNKKKLRLLITDTIINHDVYLESCRGEHSKGQGDYTYSIDFVQAKDLKVYLSGEADKKTDGKERPAPPPASTYTVKKGDSLWAIAQKLMGSGAKYAELYAANKEAIDAANKGRTNDKYMIRPGLTLVIPDTSGGAPSNSGA